MLMLCGKVFFAGRNAMKDGTAKPPPYPYVRLNPPPYPYAPAGVPVGLAMAFPPTKPPAVKSTIGAPVNIFSALTGVAES